MQRESKFGTTRSVGVAGALALALALGGCSGDQGVGVRGHLIDDKALDQIKVGSAAEQVILVMGTPSTTSTVGGKTYYYIQQKVSQPVLFLNEGDGKQEWVELASAIAQTRPKLLRPRYSGRLDP